MYYQIPLKKIKNALHPVIFSHIINIHENNNTIEQTHFSKSFTPEQISQPLNSAYPMDSIPALYQDFIIELQGKPITLEEIQKIIVKSDFDTTKTQKSSKNENLIRLNHIKNIARHMVSFSLSHYVSTQASAQFSFLEPTDNENMYLLLATIMRKQLMLQCEIPHLTALSIYDNPSDYLIPHSEMTVLDLAPYVISPESGQNNLNIAPVNSPLFNISKNNINKKFDWSIPFDTIDKPIELHNWKQYVLNKLNNNENIDFQELPTSFLNDYSTILEFSQKKPFFLHSYLLFHFNNTHSPFFIDDKLTKNNPELNSILFKERNDNILKFISDIGNTIKTHPYLLEILWEPFFKLYPTSFHEPKIDFNVGLSVHELYHLDTEKLLNDFMIEYREQHHKHFAGDAGSNHQYVQNKLFKIDTSSKLFKNVNFNDFLQTQDFVKNEIENIKNQFKPFTDIIKDIYDSHLFNSVDNLLALSHQKPMLPSISSLGLHQQEKNLYYEKLMEDKHNNSGFLSMEQLKDIHGSYFTHPDKNTQIKRRNLFLASLLEHKYQDITDFNYHQKTDLFSKIQEIDTKNGIIDTFSHFLNSPLSHTKIQSNLNFDKMNTIFQAFLVKQEEFLIDNDICKLFYKNNSRFFTFYKGSYNDLLFHFTDIEAIASINYAVPSVLNDNLCPPHWRSNPIVVNANSHIENVTFTPQELESLFSFQNHGTALIVKDHSIYQKLPEHLKEVPEYAKTFLMEIQKNANYNISNNSINLVPKILFQYHDFCISLLHSKTSQFSWIPKKHWDNQQFLIDFFKQIDLKNINLDKIFNDKKNDSGIPQHIVLFFKHYEITSSYSPFIEAYLLQQQLGDKIQTSLNKNSHLVHNDQNLNNNDSPVKKKKI